jgi:hypothetical protein
MIRTAVVIAIVFSLAAATAAAQNDSGKKTSDGFGNLLKGMGQEINKAGGSSTAPKKEAKKAAAKKSDAKKNDAKAAKKE